VEGSPDTIGAGGTFTAIRVTPILLDICHDMEDLCPDAWLLNYVNPMAINTWAMNDYTRIKSVGLCHSVQGTAVDLVDYAIGPLKPVAVPDSASPYYHLFHNQIHEEMKDVSYWVAGINHMSWFLELNWQGKDLYPLLRERFKDPAVYSGPDAHGPGPDIVRAEVFKAFGYYVTESSGHMASYLPYFKKNRALIDKYKLDEQKFANMWKVRLGWDEELKRQLHSNHQFPLIRGSEYSATIIHSLVTGTPTRINANVMNRGLITNLPEGCCVEVPCLVDKQGIHPCFVGDLPPQLAALNRTSINVQEMAVRGIVEKDKNKIFQAVLLDPLTSAILTIDEIRHMVDEMFQAEQEKYLRGFK
jgi:alpha-galactosidase